MATAEAPTIRIPKMRAKLLELLNHRPFAPIRIQLTNGVIHVIRHPDQAMVGPNYVVVGTPAHNTAGPDVADTAFVSLLHVVEIDTIQTDAASNVEPS